MAWLRLALTQHAPFLEQRLPGRQSVLLRQACTDCAVVCAWLLGCCPEEVISFSLQEKLFLFDSSFQLPVPVKSPFSKCTWCLGLEFNLNS